jgi:elongator complex protein 6
MGLRLLDTGAARDVSGVIRITVGDQISEDDQDIQRRIEERELLYFVGGDGSVRVFERGQ